MEYTCGQTANGAWAAPGQTRTTMFLVIRGTVLPPTNGTDGKPRLWTWRCAFC